MTSARSASAVAGVVALLAAGALAGCGGASGGGGLAAAPAPTATDVVQAPLGATTPAGTRARQEAIHQQVLAALRHPAADQHYGGRPSYLPAAEVPAEQVVPASEAHPALAIQGDGVDLHLRTGAARAVVVGPDVPHEYIGSNEPQSPATFVLTVSGASGTVPLHADAFTITDEQGVVHHPLVALRGGGAVPATAPEGGTVSLTLRTHLPIGNGRVRYRPPGSPTVVSWDFDNETD